MCYDFLHLAPHGLWGLWAILVMGICNFAQPVPFLQTSVSSIWQMFLKRMLTPDRPYAMREAGPPAIAGETTQPPPRSWMSQDWLLWWPVREIFSTHGRVSYPTKKCHGSDSVDINKLSGYQPRIPQGAGVGTKLMQERNRDYWHSGLLAPPDRKQPCFSTYSIGATKFPMN